MTSADSLPKAADVSPDIMNDPAFDLTRDGDRKKSVDEPDTCRICRSEGANDEPLFYPCKCSGSIKFVHQHCLVEWLSHSQKKHCELCKTPFRFTKLYDPRMPASVPTLVFLRQVIIHSWRSLVAGSRMNLVAFVWLCWLPWSMRTVWRGLFWLGDGGWIDWAQMQEEALKAAKVRMDQLATEGTSPVPRNFLPSGEFAASTVVSRLADAFPQMVSHTLNLTKGEPVLFGLARGLFRSIMGERLGNSTTPVSPAPAFNSTQVASIPYRSSWLSEISFLRTLTRYPILNNIFVDTLEGQLITMFVVIAFILIFLIREWVVQQQPAVNLPAGAAAREPLLAIENANAAPDEPHEPRGNAPEEPAEHDVAAYDWSADDSPTTEDAIPPPYQNDSGNHEVSADQVGTGIPPGADQFTQAQSEPEGSSAASPNASDSRQRPSMPDRGTLARAAEIRRTIEEQSRIRGPDWPGLQIFMDIWTHAENEPKEVLRIIEERGRNEELAWVVAAMRRLESIPLTTGDRFLGQQAAVSEDQTAADNPQPDEKTREVELQDSDPARRIHEPNFDLTQELGGSDSIEDASRNAGQGSSDPTVTPEESQIVNAHANDLKAAGITRARSISSGQSEEPLPDQAAVSIQEPLESSTPVNNNPFHPDYASPLLPHPRDDSEQSPLVATTEVINPATADASAIAQSTGTQNTPISARAEPGFVEKTMIWLWGGSRQSTTENNDQVGADVERVVQDLANEAPFVPVEHGQPMLDDRHHGDEAVAVQGPIQGPEAVADAAQAGLDPNDAEAIEEVEDLEGVMELVGMQGPIAGLIQNGMFCAVLVSLTIFLAVWIPYIMGKLFLVVLTNPVSLLVKMPLRYAAGLADFFCDAIVFIFTYAYYWVATIINFICSPLRKFQPASYLLDGDKVLADIAMDYATRSATRLGNTIIATTDNLSESDIPTFSILAHESLRSVQRKVSKTGQIFVSAAMSVCTSRVDTMQLYRYLRGLPDYQELMPILKKKSWLLSEFVDATLSNGLAWLASLKHFNPLRVNVAVSPRSHPLDFSLAYWDTRDRTIAILLGYLFFALVGVGYLKLSPLFQSKRKAEKVDGIVAEILYQAGGVLKVILIISIEMIIFPLYCGLLLDVALLPLFRDVTFLSRLEFMVNSPYTSLFVHWFVGTCYMFHFALFVSMCRKIMRTGVLYFIRDPDDPTFHPVRDVLERSVFTQLCKIAFSALVYGGLVIVCLGSVVWGISSAFDGVFPIHWSSNEPVLEFPVDLLFYNFLMPLAVRVLKPSEGLTKMYGWWFRVCARGLRLSHFLFGDKREDEEGHHIRRTWRNVFVGKRGDIKNPVIGKDQQQLAKDRGLDAYFLRDGRYVRTPASDQVRIPKGAHTFLEVDEAGNRVDGQADNDQGLHGRNNDQFSTIYVPPRFRLRISAFIALLWLFAAATGVCFTVIPLVFGRYVFTNIFPSHPRMNDVYAFCIGINILGGVTFALLNARIIFSYLQHTLVPTRESNASKILQQIAHYAIRFGRVLYTFTAFGLVLPALIALVPELYFILPLHTFFGEGVADRHIIYFIQDWVLGVLYIQMIGRLILWYEGSRPATALRNITQNGWTDPDARLATRGFIFPGMVLLSFVLLTPLGMGWVADRTFLSEADAATKSLVYRYSFPAFLGLGIGMVVLYYTAKAFQGWKKKIRDEVYLIGERLHNFGEGKRVNAVGGNRVAM
ncbi:MAG: hypothetical protein Q9166_004263 [cf. Caloplaca sp. 2 TL-2023]